MRGEWALQGNETTGGTVNRGRKEEVRQTEKGQNPRKKSEGPSLSFYKEKIKTRFPRAEWGYSNRSRKKSGEGLVQGDGSGKNGRLKRPVPATALKKKTENKNPPKLGKGGKDKTARMKSKKRERSKEPGSETSEVW